MLIFPSSLRVFVALESCDMRESFNGLLVFAAEKFKEDPQRGALFVFTNKVGNRLKILDDATLAAIDAVSQEILCWIG